jgi:hypothetical protein
LQRFWAENLWNEDFVASLSEKQVVCGDDNKKGKAKAKRLR